MEETTHIIREQIKKLTNGEVNTMANVLLTSTITFKMPFSTKYQKTPTIWWAADLLHYLDDVELNDDKLEICNVRVLFCTILLTINSYKIYNA